MFGLCSHTWRRNRSVKTRPHGDIVNIFIETRGFADVAYAYRVVSNRTQSLDEFYV